MVHKLHVHFGEEQVKQLQQEVSVTILFGELLLNRYLEETIREQPLGNK